MARVQDTRSFDYDSFRATKAAMRARGEDKDVHRAGREYREKMGGIHPFVDIVGKPPRFSHNAMAPGEDGTVVLTNGISLPILSMFDGTGSTAHWVSDFFRTAERQHKLLDGLRTRYNPQLATGVVQDVYNVKHDGLPVVQVSQFEADERSAEQVRLLQPASMGNDSSTEDYDLGLFYGTMIGADIWDFYGLRGYMTLALDEIGRGFVTTSDIRNYLGQPLDMDRMETDEICQLLLKHWHFFILQVPTGYGGLIPYTTEWWSDKIGASRIIKVEDPRLLADVRAALIYVTEAEHPSRQGLIEFLKSDNTEEVRINARDLDQVWKSVQVAGEYFGAQAKLPEYQDIPRPGDVFTHYRHAWPIGHPRAGENVTPAEG